MKWKGYDVVCGVLHATKQTQQKKLNKQKIWKIYKAQTKWNIYLKKLSEFVQWPFVS